MKLALVKGDIKVQGGVDRPSGEVLRNEVGVRGQRSVLDRHRVQRLERVHKSQGFAILLEDTEPAAVVRRGGRFVHSRTPLVLDDLRDFGEQSTGNRTLPENPRNMLDMGDLDGVEVLWVEGTSLVIVPSKSGVVSTE